MSDPAILSDGDLSLLAKAGVSRGEIIAVEPLTGGVSSTVLSVTTRHRRVVVKRALERLKVGDGWQADPGRSLIEAAYSAILAELAPANALRVLAVDARCPAFVMEHAPAGSVNWKTELLAGRISSDAALRLGRAIATVHGSTHETSTMERFADRSGFESLRIEPYFLHAMAHGAPAKPMEELIAMLRRPGIALVHGDLSPKNVLITRDGDPLLLDHEVAHWGDPAFDLAFLLSHLTLKAVHRPSDGVRYAAAAAAFLDGYTTPGSSDSTLLERAGFVCAGLLVARIDGRSPVEYLESNEQESVRSIAHRLLSSPVPADLLLDEANRMHRSNAGRNV